MDWSANWPALSDIKLSLITGNSLESSMMQWNLEVWIIQTSPPIESPPVNSMLFKYLEVWIIYDLKWLFICL